MTNSIFSDKPYINGELPFAQFKQVFRSSLLVRHPLILTSLSANSKALHFLSLSLYPESSLLYLAHIQCMWRRTNIDSSLPCRRVQCIHSIGSTLYLRRNPEAMNRELGQVWLKLVERTSSILNDNKENLINVHIHFKSS